jgi:hypothetical protein
MHNGSRAFLFIAALLCGGYIAYLGASFSRDVEPESFTPVTGAFWLAVGLLATFPIWLPAVVPSRFPSIARAAGWISVVGCLVLLLVFGSPIIHNLRRAFAGHEFFASVLAINSLLFLVCLAVVAVVLGSRRAVSRMRA